MATGEVHGLLGVSPHILCLSDVVDEIFEVRVGVRACFQELETPIKLSSQVR